MNVRAAYLDTSAFLKLIVPEAETTALQRYLARWPERASATLIRTEAVRALRRAGHDGRVGPARRAIGAMRLIRVDEPLLDRAAEIAPRELRSLDAVHLAAALALGPDLGVLLTYDERLGSAARHQGVVVQSPA